MAEENTTAMRMLDTALAVALGAGAVGAVWWWQVNSEIDEDTVEVSALPDVRAKSCSRLAGEEPDRGDQGEEDPAGSHLNRARTASWRRRRRG